MKQLIITICILFVTYFNSFSQTFSQQNFKFDGICNLQNAVNTVDENGNKVTVYQCVNQASSINVYRINVIAFKAIITDIEEYYRSLKKEYSNLGTPTSTTLKGKKAVQVIENVTIEGHSMKQISVSTLYKNKAITLVLVTNSSSYSTLLSNFKNQFSFL
ncbi:MAG: hypothetical protein H7Z76_12320 [Methylotenera sp.]|nr:hypothetical protein [Flavobacterium sp.]